ncbi:MAG TPA: hypothetical protein VGR92_06080 [Steroidobacteraceae bacterium]|nr:hypothetical protein [Steroidobacteraceae bacterium]
MTTREEQARATYAHETARVRQGQAAAKEHEDRERARREAELRGERDRALSQKGELL